MDMSNSRSDHQQVRTLREDGETYKIGKAYERWLAECFGFAPNDGMLDELTRGDTGCAKEIKYDRKYHKTNRLFIETEERPIGSDNWHPSPVFVDSKYLLIGDCRTLFWIPCQMIRDYRQDQSPRIIQNEVQRARGFVLPSALPKSIVWRRSGCRVIDMGTRPPLAINERCLRLEPVELNDYYAFQQQPLF